MAQRGLRGRPVVEHDGADIRADQEPVRVQGDAQEGDVRGSLSITASTPVKCPCASSTTGAPLPTDQRGVLFEQPGKGDELHHGLRLG